VHLAFCLFKYFPFGGLQRDFLHIAQACRQNGHRITVYTMSWQGPRIAEFVIKILAQHGWQNHQRNHYFCQQLQQERKNAQIDLLLGFNKIPGIDLYYAADGCYAQRYHEQQKFWQRCLPRSRSYLCAEQQTINNPLTKILFLHCRQLDDYARYYQLPPSRYQILPPNLERERLPPDNATIVREQQRILYKVGMDRVLLFVAAKFKTKGLDRVLSGFAALPEPLRQHTRLWVVGDDNFKPFLKQAQQLKIARQLRFFGGQEAVGKFMLAADVLVHPAYEESGGKVLLEALINGLPILTVASCGYAAYVSQVNGGIVLPMPFSQLQFNQQLQYMLMAPELATWRRNGLAFGKKASRCNWAAQAVSYIESLG
jgi:UDP-glucose:(heptosyl)LPS alpha-1,3-glucosyltransferase